MKLLRPATASVAVFDCELRLAELINAILADEMTEVRHYATTATPRNTARVERPDVVVINRETSRNLERQIRRMRCRWPTIAIFVVNARDDMEVESLLDAGADDVVVVESPVLAARLHAQTRRARTVTASTRVAVGDVVFDREARRVWCAGREVRLTPMEQSLLDCLFWHAPAAVGVRAIADFVWRNKPSRDTTRRAMVQVYVGYLRRKLASSRSVMIRTVRGVGYQFVLRPNTPRN